jgi:HK97 family phage portal protein
MRNPLGGLGSKVANVLGFEKRGVGPSPGDQTFWKSFTQLMSGNNGITSPYAESVWVYSAVKKIATNISGTPFKLYRTESDGEKIEVTEGELVDLFRRPNPDTTPEEMWEATQTYLDLRGNAFWILERPNIAAIPQEIRVVDPLRMTPAFNASRTALIGWVYGNGKIKIPFQLHEVLHFKYFNPDDPLMGIAPYRCISVVADQDYFSNIYNKTFFKEGAAISGFIEAEKGLTDTQYSRLLNQINDRHQGMSKAHRIGLLENGAKFQAAKMTQKDMDFIEGKKMGKKEIYTAYGTNDVVQGFFEDVKSYEGMKTAMKAFWEGTLIPRGKHLQGTVNAKFLSYFGDHKLYGEFDLSDVSALKEDFSDKVKNGKELFAMGYTRNEVNERLGLGMKEAPSGDISYLPSSVLPADGSGTPPVEPDNNDDGTKALLPSKTKQADGEEEIELERTEEDGRVWTDFLKVQAPIERDFLSMIRRYFIASQIRTITNLNNYYKKDAPPTTAGDLLQRTVKATVLTKSLSDDIYNKIDEVKHLDDAMIPLYSIALEAGADMVAEELGVAFTFDKLDPSFLKWQQMRIKNISPEMIDTIEKGLRATLTEGLVAGEGVAQLADRVKEVYAFAQARANTIARTESASMIEAGRYQNMIKHGIKRHQWFTAMDGEVRDTHKALHGSTQVIGLKFKYVRGIQTGQSSPLRFPTDMAAPAAQVINCRCLTLPVVE